MFVGIDVSARLGRPFRSGFEVGHAFGWVPFTWASKRGVGWDVGWWLVGHWRCGDSGLCC